MKAAKNFKIKYQLLGLTVVSLLCISFAQADTYQLEEMKCKDGTNVSVDVTNIYYDLIFKFGTERGDITAISSTIKLIEKAKEFKDIKPATRLTYKKGAGGNLYYLVSMKKDVRRCSMFPVPNAWQLN